MVRAALRNPYAVIVMALAILVIGVTAITRIPTDILPTFKTPAVQVLTLYPGMPADVMERDLTARLAAGHQRGHRPRRLRWEAPTNPGVRGPRKGPGSRPLAS